MNRIKNWIIILFSSGLIVVCLGLFIPRIIDKIKSDNHVNVSRKAKTKDNYSIVNDVLSVISVGHRETFGEKIQLLFDDENISEEVKDYFQYFLEYDEKIHAEKRDKKLASDTQYFIEQREIIEQCFVQGELSRKQASIVPYYFIKEFDAKEKNQNKLRMIYNNYIDCFVDGFTSLDEKGANVFCLYVFATHKSYKSDNEYAALKTEIEQFIKQHDMELNKDNGSLSIQKTYLHEVLELLNTKKRNKIKPYPIANL